MHNGPQLQIRPSRESDATSVCDAVNAVGAERWYLAAVDGFSLEQARAFLKRVVDGSLPQVVAVVEDESGSSVVYDLRSRARNLPSAIARLATCRSPEFTRAPRAASIRAAASSQRDSLVAELPIRTTIQVKFKGEITCP
jgi:hypothetical protein